MSEPPPTLSVEVQIELESDVAVRPERLIAAAEAAAGEAGFLTPAEMTLLVADDARVQELNRAYRGVDAVTDVLAFGEESAGDDTPAAPFVLPADAGPRYLGDVIISLPQAARQAGERGHALESELCLLVVHGTLHLLGHEHAEADETRRMWDVQRRALRRLGCEEAAPPEPA